MRLPPPHAHYTQRVRFGRYLARRMRQANMTSLATDAETVSLAIKQAGRAIEDAEDAIQEALADRDGADALLDFAAQNARNEIAGRSVDAVRTEPYRSIFHKGIGYYIAAPLGEQNARYQELAKRVEANLPAGDPVRESVIKAVNEGLEGFNVAVKALETARTNASMLSTKLTTAVEAWNRQIEKTYGALVIELGRAQADGFFPRVRTHRTPEVTEPTADTPRMPDPTD